MRPASDRHEGFEFPSRMPNEISILTSLNPGSTARTAAHRGRMPPSGPWLAPPPWRSVLDTLHLCRPRISLENLPGGAHDTMDT